MSEQQKYVSFATEDLREQSNLFDDVDARIKAFAFTMTPPSDNYKTEDGGTPIFAVITFLIDGDAPEQERTVTQSYSLGSKSSTEFVISNDRYGLIPIEDANKPRAGCKFTTLTEQFQKVGITSTLLKNGNFGNLIGLYGHWKRIADVPRTFGDQDQLSKRKKSKFPPSTLILIRVIAMPGEAVAPAKAAKASKANGKVAAAPVAAAPAEDTTPESDITETGDDEYDTMEYLLAALRKANGTLQRGQITLAMGHAAGLKNPKRSVFAKKAFDEAYLLGLADQGVIRFEQAEKGQPVSLVA